MQLLQYRRAIVANSPRTSRTVVMTPPHSRYDTVVQSLRRRHAVVVTFGAVVGTPQRGRCDATTRLLRLCRAVVATLPRGH